MEKKRDGRWARVGLVAIGVVTLLVGVGSAFEAGDSDDQLLIATFGAGMGLFGIGLALVAIGQRSRLAWAMLWYYPVFFAVHIAGFGTWVPDLPLLAIVVASLLGSRQLVLGDDSRAAPAGGSTAGAGV